MKKQAYHFCKSAIALGFVLGLGITKSYSQTTTLPRLLAVSKANGPTGSIYYPADSTQYFYPSDSTPYYYLTEGASLAAGNVRYVYTGGWVIGSRQSFTYDTGGKMTQNLEELYNTSTGNYDKSGRFLWTFNAAGKQTSKEGQLWRTGATSWEIWNRQEQTYDAANNLIKITYPLPVNGAWTNGKQSLFTNNAQGNPVTQVDQTWTNSAWLNTVRSNWLYDASGRNATQRMVQIWDARGATWIDRTRYQYTLNAAGKTSQEIQSTWDTTVRAWDLRTQRTTYTYNNAGDMTRKLIEYNNSTTVVNYENYFETKYTYNSTNQLLTETVLGSNNNVFSINKNSSIWRYYYEPSAPTGISSSKANGAVLAVYPNPATDELHINLKWSEAQPFTATLTDMAGRVYTSFSGPVSKNYSTTLSLGHVASGNFLLSIHGGNSSVTTKMITVKH